jgi:hypothetical protein
LGVKSSADLSLGVVSGSSIGELGADLVRLGRAEAGVEGEGLCPVIAGLAGPGQRVIGAGEAVVRAGLLVLVADIAGYLARGSVVGAGAAGLVGREMRLAEAVQCVGFTGPVADLLVQGQGLLDAVAGLPGRRWTSPILVSASAWS